MRESFNVSFSVKLYEQLYLIVHINIRSLSAHFDDLTVFIRNCAKPPFAICISETWLNDDMSIDLYNIPGYTLYVKNRNGWGGGVCVYICELVVCKVKIHFTGDLNIDTLKIEDTYSKLLKQVVESNGCRFMFSLPTRITSTSKTCIDHMITNFGDHFDSSGTLNFR